MREVFAKVTNSQYIYDQQPAISGGPDKLLLKEIHYDAVFLPECWRPQSD